jgi:hypothetical protein
MVLGSVDDVVALRKKVVVFKSVKRCKWDGCAGWAEL